LRGQFLSQVVLPRRFSGYRDVKLHPAIFTYKLHNSTVNTHITFVLDSSGSMAEIKDDTVGGFNTFLQEQSETEGSASVTLYDFNDNINLVYQAQPIEEASELSGSNYSPGGRTALHDAIITAINSSADRINELQTDERPDNVIIVVLTDGKENASETPQATVRDQVDYRQTEHEWEFLFIGANQDATLTASKMGMKEDQALSMSHSGEGAQAAYESTSDIISQTRETGEVEGYSEEDRQRQRDAE